MSGLKVNFHKSLLVGINIGDSWLTEAASILNCKVGEIPFLYLGLSIGGDPRRGWFGERVSKVIGNGKSTFFWYDNWLGDVGRWGERRGGGGEDCGCRSEETASHLFLHCEVFGLLEYHIRSFKGSSIISPITLTSVCLAALE
ncbi:hypothetical protein MTR_1g049220 [Medicago truncatula]|uniref:Reverse transcriptase zinc-binding domain-containing protein n=1 Tax=Medicago truncatula TaxID=3880 RepID=A0A072VTF8_MEDTR|nr:hypothetical protein MTR_1g049220 [Medicago truncatula]